MPGLENLFKVACTVTTAGTAANSARNQLWLMRFFRHMGFLPTYAVGFDNSLERLVAAVTFQLWCLLISIRKGDYIHQDIRSLYLSSF